MFCLLLVFGLGTPAMAEPVPESAPAPWYQGQSLVQVGLEAPEGGLPQENLQPLLKAAQGEPYDPRAIRADLALLYSLGLFEAVEAHVEPWAMFDETDGVGVLLTYRVYPATTLRRVVVRGNRAMRDAELRAEAGVDRGSRFVPEEDLEPLRWRLVAAYAMRGYAEVSLDISVVDHGEGALDLVIEVREGKPLVLGELRYQGTDALSARRMGWLGLRNGLRSGGRYTLEEVDRTRERLEARMHARGWPDAKVTPVLSPPFRSGQGDLLSFLVQPGLRLQVEVRGEDMPRQARVEALLAPRLTGRLGETELEVARRELEAAFQREGHREAQVTLRLEETASVRRVLVEGALGPVHRLARDGIRVEGTALFDPGFLVSALRESSDVLAQGFLTEEELDQGTAALEDLYRAQGHLDVRVRSDVEELQREADRVRLALRVEVTEGVRTVLESIELVGVVPDLEAGFQLAAQALEGEALNPSAVQDLARRVTETHRELGYLRADTTANLQVSRDGHSASLRMAVVPGAQSHLRNVIIRGNRRTRRSIIAQQVALETGAPITPSALARTRQHLYSLDLFRVVDVRLEGDDATVRDLVIEVREKPTTSLEAGGGVATDTGVRVFSRATRRNLLGRGHRISALGEVGIGYEGDDWRLDTTALEWRAAGRYEAPRVLPGASLVFVDVLARERQQEPTFRLERTGVGLGVQLGEAERIRVVATYQVQQRWLQDVAAGSLVGGDPWLEGADPTEDLALPMGPRLHKGPSFSAFLDRRDDRLNPTRGVLTSIQVDGTNLVAGDRTVRLLGQGRAIVPLGPIGLQLGGGAGLGWAEGRTATLPLEERFRIGGASTLRGYALDSVGPKNRVALSDIDWPEALEPLVEEAARDATDRWVPTGGDAMLHTSAELWVPLKVMGLSRTDTTSLVGFVDAGNVFFVDPTVLATSAVVDPEPLLRYGVGAGLRIRTPVGPMQVDVGVNPQYFAAAWPEERGEDHMPPGRK